jgi:DNA-binding CsgD family transcriptional regulator
VAEPKEPLTERELEVVKLVADGASNKQIAATLFISENTVKAHLKSIFVKLEAESRAKVAAIAQRNGWTVQAPIEGSAPVHQRDVERATDVGDAAMEKSDPSAEARMIVAPPVPVAPNPPIPQPLAIWRRAALVTALIAALAMSAWSLRADGRRVEPMAEREFVSPAEAAVPEDAGTSSRWIARAALPEARTRGAAFGVAGKIVLVGGTLDAQAAGDLLIYEPRTNEWRAGASKPTPLRLAAGAVLSNVVYVPAGTDGDGAPTVRFEAYDVAADRWSRLPSLPRAMSGHVAAAAAGHIYVFGGRLSDESFNTEGFSYDPVQQRWSRLAGLPTVRSQAAAAVVNGRIYVVGGTDGRQELTTCEYYDLASGSWGTCRPMSIARGGLGLAQVGIGLYAIGGGVVANYIPFNERYDAATDSWEPFEIPAARAGTWKNPAVASLPTEFYVIGGSTGAELRRETFVYEVLTNKSFLPSLQNAP